MRMPSADSHPHLGGCHLDQPDMYTYLVDIWQYLQKVWSVKSVVDIGCGLGYACKWWLDAGAKPVIGIDGYHEAAAHSVINNEAHRIIHDYATGPCGKREMESYKVGLKAKFDLAWAAEFVEHVEEQYIPNWMATAKLAKIVVITYGRPGQDGWHHVNLQELPYWIEQFGKYGFTHDAHATEFMRSTSDGTESWGRPTLTLFKNDAFDA